MQLVSRAHPRCVSALELCLHLRIRIKARDHIVLLFWRAHPRCGCASESTRAIIECCCSGARILVALAYRIQLICEINRRYSSRRMMEESKRNRIKARNRRAYRSFTHRILSIAGFRSKNQNATKSKRDHRLLLFWRAHPRCVSAWEDSAHLRIASSLH
jgi:hypothetical protein